MHLLFHWNHRSQLVFFWVVSFPLDYFKSGWIKWFQNFIIGFRSDWSDQGIADSRGESRIHVSASEKWDNSNQSKQNFTNLTPFLSDLRLYKILEVNRTLNSDKFYQKSKSVKIQNRLESLKIGKTKNQKDRQQNVQIKEFAETFPVEGKIWP